MGRKVQENNGKVNANEQNKEWSKFSEIYLAGPSYRLVVIELGRILLLHTFINIRFTKDINRVSNIMTRFTRLP